MTLRVPEQMNAKRQVKARANALLLAVGRSRREQQVADRRASNGSGTVMLTVSASFGGLLPTC
jgi:hypothetical protein